MMIQPDTYILSSKTYKVVQCIISIVDKYSHKII